MPTVPVDVTDEATAVDARVTSYTSTDRFIADDRAAYQPSNPALWPYSPIYDVEFSAVVYDFTVR